MAQHSLFSNLESSVLPSEEMDRLEVCSIGESAFIRFDTLQNYDILETISSRGSTCVYQAKSIKGRMKGRLIALKKYASQDIISTEALHQGLYHLNIVSLLSSFSVSQYRYHILELCSGGSLSDLLKSQKGCILSEQETVSIARPLIDALSYLKREGIVHRNINPKTILFTTDRRLKLTNFTRAIHLPSQDITVDYFIEHPHFSSPELLSRERCDYASDLWSLGVLIFRCCSGQMPFQASATRGVIENILGGRFTTPSAVSSPFSELISRLLSINPSRRPDVQSISSYLPFSEFSSVPDPPQAAAKSLKPRPLPYRIPSSKSENFCKDIKATRTPLQDIRNVDLQRILSDEVTDSLKFQDRRAVSDPHPKFDMSKTTKHDNRRMSSLKLAPLTAPPQGLLSSRLSLHLRPFKTPISESLATADLVKTDRVHKPSDSDITSESDKSDSDITVLPVGTVRPSSFTTTLLAPRVHKTVNGQITILPSRSALVDFREGERRRGRKGTEVLVVSPDGREVKIYDAPHLSTPCCLAEVKETYDLEDLPRRFWKQYNDAGALIARIKQRTPRMVLYDQDAQCTLMGNGPQGDVELLFQNGVSSQSVTKKSQEKDASETPTRRLRYSRQTRMLEISNYTSSAQGKEWKTTTHHIHSDDSGDVDRSTFELPGLTSDDDESITQLLRFLRVCAAVEADDCTFAHKEEPVHSEPHSNQTLSLCGSGSTSTHNVAGSRSNSGSSRTIARSLSIVDLAPRPTTKFSCSTSKSSDVRLPLSTKKPTSSAHTYDTFDLLESQVTKANTDTTPAWIRDHSLGLGQQGTTTTGGVATVQSKFIPSVGWCVRHDSRVSQGGRWKIMFLDGAVLDVDADEEWAELTGKDGMRYR
ncbi:hypothetical protein V5O48_010951 [Marasmius crinis-equi]|uniref:Non-specific serine/threonine protein kinase n=1 Tax=Marasmius crinis-equi TaxID=585013 RepID=A0ABR3F7F1_9AGAR